MGMIEGDYCILVRDSVGELCALPVGLHSYSFFWDSVAFPDRMKTIWSTGATTQGYIYEDTAGVKAEVYLIPDDPWPDGSSIYLAANRIPAKLQINQHVHTASLAETAYAEVWYRLVTDDYDFSALTWADRPTGDASTATRLVTLDGGSVLSAGADAAITGNTIVAQQYCNTVSFFGTTLRFTNNTGSNAYAVRLYIDNFSIPAGGYAQMLKISGYIYSWYQFR